MKEQLRGFLIDLDGVVYSHDKLIAGAAETLQSLRSSKIPFRFLTNTTIDSRDSLVAKLNGLGISVGPEEIFSTCVVAAHWARKQGWSKLHLLLPEEPKRDFSGFETSAAEPDAVIVGDLGDGFTFDILNQAFRMLKAGAKLVALQKNRFWMTTGGLSLDAGPFVTALEYAAQTTATVIGKPSQEYFQAALADLALPAASVAMIGDDVDTDIAGAKKLGLQTVLVKTGKYRGERLRHGRIRPDWVLESIRDLSSLLQPPE